MRVGPFPFEWLPRLRRGELALMRELRAILGPQRSAAFERWAARIGLAEGERCAVRATLLPELSPEARRATIEGALRLELLGPDGRRAWLLLDGGLTAAVVSLLLQVEPLPLCTRPSLGERGLCTYALAALLVELGPAGWTVALREPDGAPPAGSALQCRVELGGARAGLAWLLLDESGLPAASTGAGELRIERLQCIDLALPLEVGHLRLPAAELDALGAGDVLLFPGCPAPAAELGAELRVGAGGFPARVTGLAGGDSRELLSARIEEPFRIGGTTMSQGKQQRALAEELQIELVVELGRARLTGAQLMELGPGDVLTLERPLAAPLDLRVGDRLIARGELVAVDGEAGVRLTQIYD